MAIPFTPSEFLFVFAATVFGLGVLSTLLGFLMLISRSYGREMKVLAVQSAKLSQKSASDNIALVTNSTAQLMDALNNLVRTSTGIGVFFVLVGMAMIAAAYYVVVNTNLTIA